MKPGEDNRPDPDQILASLVSDEEKGKRGRLKIFFGMCAGVGKTYTMLQTAHIEKAKGSDIVIGYVETHGRRDTEELVAGFELVQRKIFHYKSANLEEMDIDAIITRKPETVLIDELAHSNAPGSRHLKRYMDVQEILENGINVYTTLNVQHLISRTDTVSQITGIKVMETVPDEIFETADEVELVDLTPEELLQRLAEGKVYTPERSKEAVQNFFRKGNITALREMALRIVADRVDKQLQDYLRNNRIRGPWKSGIHLLVAIDYRQQSTRLLRWAKNLAYSMGGHIQGLYVETAHNLTAAEREQLDRNLKIAKQLGIPIRITSNTDIVKAVIDYAQKENISHIIVGKPRVRNIFSMLKFGSFVDKLIRYSGNIDVYVLGSDVHAKDSYKGKLSLPAFTPNLGQYLVSVFVVAIASLASYALKDFIGYQSVSFILLFVVSIMAMIFGTGPIIVSALMSALIWDYFFIPPEFTFHIDRLEDVLMLFMYFFIAIISGALTSRIRRQEKKTRIREERTNALYQLTKDLSRISGTAEVTRVASNYISRYFSLDCVVFVMDENNRLEIISKSETATLITENEKSVASWVFRNAAKAGRFTDTLPSGEFTYYPLTGDSGNMGVLAVRHPKPFTHGEEQFWEAFLAQISSKYERELLREAAKHTLLLNESEKLYRNLFNSLSHELRTPVSAIVGASDALIEKEFPPETRNKLYHEISLASLRLNRLINNLLNMSRLESGRITIRPDWCDIHDMANSLTESLRNELEPFVFSVVIPPGMPLVFIDSGLIEQVVSNLVLNSTQYAPPASQIRVKFYYDDSSLIIQVMDRGPGIPPSEINSVFEKFYRGKSARSGGTGLGLSIVKGFVEAHNGSVSAANRKNGGAIFTVSIPVEISEPDKIIGSTP